MITPKIRTPRGRLSHLQAAAGVDAWSTKERICLIETVMKYGTEDWNEVSKAMFEFVKPARSKEWCSPTNCTREFQVAVEFAGKIVRKQGVVGGGTDYLGHIRQYFVGERLKELKNLEEEQLSKYTNLFKFNQEIAAGQHDDKVEALITAYDAEGIRLPEDDEQPNYSELSELADLSDRMNVIQSIINQVIGRTAQPVIESKEGEGSQRLTETGLSGMTEEDDDLSELMDILPNMESLVEYDPAIIDTSEFDLGSPSDSASVKKPSTAASPKTSPHVGSRARISSGAAKTEDQPRLNPEAPTLSVLLGMPAVDPSQSCVTIEAAATDTKSIPSTSSTLARKAGYMTPPSASPSKRESPMKTSSSPTLQRLLEGTMFSKKDSVEGKALEELAVEAIVSGVADVESKEHEKESPIPMETSESDASPGPNKYTVAVVVKPAVPVEEPMEVPLSPVIAASVAPDVPTVAPARSPSKRVDTKLVAADSGICAAPKEIKVGSNSPIKSAVSSKSSSPVKTPVKNSLSPSKSTNPPNMSPMMTELKVEKVDEAETKPDLPKQDSDDQTTIIGAAIKTSDEQRPRPIDSRSTDASLSAVEETSPEKVPPKVVEREPAQEGPSEQAGNESEDEISSKPVLIPSRTYSRKQRFGDADEEEEEASSSESEVVQNLKAESPVRTASPGRPPKSQSGSASPSKRGRKSRKEVQAGGTPEAVEEESRATRATRSNPIAASKNASSTSSTPKSDETAEQSKETAKVTAARATRSRTSLVPPPLPLTSDGKPSVATSSIKKLQLQSSDQEKDEKPPAITDLDSMFGAGRPLRDRSRSGVKTVDSLAGTTLESNPSSPSSTTTTSTTMDDDKEHRAFRKSITFLWEQIKSHKHAGQFLKPITDATAPSYSTTVFRPMDLTTLKRRVDQNKILTIQAFEKEIYLMLMNAVMFNPSDHEITKWTLEMEKDVSSLIETFKATQKALKANSSTSGESGSTSKDSIVRSPVKLRPSIRRTKKSESDFDDLHDEFASGDHTPLSLTDAEMDDSESDKHGAHKGRESSPDITLGTKQRHSRSSSRRFPDRTSSTEGISPDVLTTQSSRLSEH